MKKNENKKIIKIVLICIVLIIICILSYFIYNYKYKTDIIIIDNSNNFKQYYIFDFNIFDRCLKGKDIIVLNDKEEAKNQYNSKKQILDNWTKYNNKKYKIDIVENAIVSDMDCKGNSRNNILESYNTYIKADENVKVIDDNTIVYHFVY